MNNLTALTRSAIPSHAVNRPSGTALLKHNSYRVGKANGVVRGVGRQEKHVALVDDQISKDTVIDDFEYHCAAVLIKPLWCLVDVVIGAGVGAADNLVLSVNSCTNVIRTGIVQGDERNSP